jgi:choline dehydrogenase-like flavoprotein
LADADVPRRQSSALPLTPAVETTEVQWSTRATAASLGPAHAAGTCRAGPSGDPASVVDQLCRVHGLEARRVADAAIMPADRRANTHVTTVMIGEKIADAMAGQAGWASPVPVEKAS